MAKIAPDYNYTTVSHYQCLTYTGDINPDVNRGSSLEDGKCGIIIKYTF